MSVAVQRSTSLIRVRWPPPPSGSTFPVGVFAFQVIGGVPGAIGAGDVRPSEVAADSYWKLEAAT